MSSRRKAREKIRWSKMPETNNKQFNNWREVHKIMNQDENKVDFLDGPSLIINQMEYIVKLDKETGYLIIQCGCCGKNLIFNKSHIYALIPFMKMFTESNNPQMFWDKVKELWSTAVNEDISLNDPISIQEKESQEGQT